MRKTESYRRHHKDLYGLLDQIESHLNAGKVSDELEAVSGTVRLLFGKFGTHLAIEDKAFYPKAIGSAHSGLSNLAKRFQDEMGPISTQFQAYRSKWPGPIAISQAPDEFVRETRDVIKAFHYRLKREETELYELFDKEG